MTSTCYRTWSLHASWIFSKLFWPKFNCYVIYVHINLRDGHLQTALSFLLNARDYSLPEFCMEWAEYKKHQVCKKKYISCNLLSNGYNRSLCIHKCLFLIFIANWIILKVIVFPATYLSLFSGSFHHMKLFKAYKKLWSKRL